MGLIDRGVRGARQEVAEAVFSRLVARELKRGSLLPAGENRSTSDYPRDAEPADPAAGCGKWQKRVARIANYT